MSSRVRAPSVRAENSIVAHPSASAVYGVDFTDGLPAGATIASAVVSVSPTGPTLGDPSSNASTFTNAKGATVEVGCGIQFRISGGTAGTDYLITAVATCDDSDTTVLVCVLPLMVRDGTEDDA